MKPAEPPPRPYAIIDAVSRVTGVTYSEMVGNRKHPEIVLARQAATYLIRRLTTRSLHEITAEMGRTGSCHSISMTRIRKAEMRLAPGCEHHSGFCEIVRLADLISRGEIPVLPKPEDLFRRDYGATAPHP